MVEDSKIRDADRCGSVEKTSVQDAFVSWMTLPNVIALAVIVGYVYFLIRMLGMTTVTDDKIWTRSAYLLTGYEAIAFAAAGYIFGKEVHRQQAENAENRAEKSQCEASEAQNSATEALTKGYRLTEAIKARATAQPNIELQAKGIGIPSGDLEGDQVDLAYLASLADELFPTKPK